MKTTRERFWEKVEVGPKGDCWDCAQNIKYMKAWSYLPGAGGWKEGSAHDRPN